MKLWSSLVVLIALLVAAVSWLPLAEAQIDFGDFTVQNWGPKIVPKYGAHIFVHGMGFTNYGPYMVCGVNLQDRFQVVAISDSLLVCIFPSTATLTASSTNLILQIPGTDVIVTLPGISRDQSLEPVVTNVYVTHQDAPTIKRNHISRCGPGSRIVVEGTNLGAMSGFTVNSLTVGISYLDSLDGRFVSEVVPTPSTNFPMSSVVYNWVGGASVTGVFALRSCVGRDVFGCGASDCGSWSITSTLPNPLPFMGGELTVTGQNFGTSQQIMCAARNDYNYRATIINDNTIICPIARDGLETSFGLVLWDPRYLQGLTWTRVYNSLTTINGAHPSISGGVYVTDPAYPGQKLDYIPVCPLSPAARLVIEGQNLGVTNSTYDYVVAGAPKLRSFSIESITPTKIVSKIDSVSTNVQFAPLSIYIGFGGLGGYTNSGTSKISAHC